MAKIQLGQVKPERRDTARRALQLATLMETYVASGNGMELMDAVASLYMAVE